MQPHYSFLQAQVLSFFSKKLYQDVYLRWKAHGLFYTLKQSFLLASLIILLMIFALSKIQPEKPLRAFSYWALGNNQSVTTEEALNRLVSIITHLPELHFVNNQLSANPSTPVIITDPINKRAIMTIDTKSNDNNKPEYRYRNFFTIHADGIYTQNVLITFRALIYRGGLIEETRFQDLLQVINQFPELHFANGKLETPINKPIYLSGDNQKAPLVIIDTTGKKTSLEANDTALALLTKESLVFKHPLNQRIIHKKWNKLSADELYQDLAETIKLAQYITMFTCLLFIPILLLLIFIFLTPFILLFSFVILQLSAQSSTPLTYAQATRLSAVAFTPTLLLMILTLPTFSNTSLLLYLMVALGYSYFAVRNINHNQHLNHS